MAILTQLFLPLSLIAWLALFPPANLFVFAAQVTATLSLVVALLLAAIWLIFPWWLPWLYLILLAFLFPIIFVRNSSSLQKTMPRGWFEWFGIFIFVILSIFTGAINFDALAGRETPNDVVNLAFPLGSGVYYVANGGASESVNAHLFTLQPKTARQEAYKGQSFAVDLVAINSWGLSANRWRPRDPQLYRIFAQPVLAPCDGRVIAVDSDRPDMQVPDTDQNQIEGNFVFLDCDGFSVLLAHLQQDSVTVAVGDRVRVGAQIGRVGNSGQSSEPHLHIHAQRPGVGGDLFSGEPLHITLDGDFPVRNELFKITDSKS